MMLHCFIQHYHWGKKGSNSVVAKLAAGNIKTSVIVEDKPYAELWIGSHKNGPSVVIENGLLLNDWIKKHPSLLGLLVKEKFKDLPFLLKVLSVEMALSIQAHPSKEHAEILHMKSPDIYTDSNHKPEMAIALTEFEAMCGFRPYAEIKKFFQALPELRKVIGEKPVTDFEKADAAHSNRDLRNCFQALMTASPAAVADGLNSLINRLHNLDAPTYQSLLGSLVEKLHSQYPGDVGVFGPYFFNYLVLKPGDALYIGPNEPHAYISGDCVECMACSDNVVRAGLTPKLKDVNTLHQMLNYNPTPASTKLLSGKREDSHTVVFIPPVMDFAVAEIRIEANKEFCFSCRNSPSLCIVIEGEGNLNGKPFNKGSAFFLKLNEKHVIVSETSVLIYQAFANV